MTLQHSPRAWRVTMKAVSKGEPLSHVVIRADRLETITQLGLVFSNAPDHVVDVVPFGAFIRAVAVDPVTLEELHVIRTYSGPQPDED